MIELFTQWCEVFGLLLGAHFFFDFPGQGDFLAKAKSHTSPLPGIDWNWALTAHAVIHGTVVGVITGSVWLGLAEAVTHHFIDFAKNDGALTFSEDQTAHIFCKVLWSLIYMLGVIWS